MVLLGFFILSILSGLFVFLLGYKSNPSKTLVKTFVLIFAFLHLALVAYCWMHIEETELTYFTFDKLGVLLTGCPFLHLLLFIMASFILKKLQNVLQYITHLIA